MPGAKSCTTCWLLSLAWIGVVGALGLINWPQLPLDMSPIDPATVMALRSALLQHVATYAAVALAPVAVAWLLRRRSANRMP